MLQFFSSNTLLSAASGLLCVRTESAWDVEVPMYFGFDSHGVPISPSGSGMWTGYNGAYTNRGAPSVSAAFLAEDYARRVAREVGKAPVQPRVRVHDDAGRLVFHLLARKRTVDPGRGNAPHAPGLVVTLHAGDTPVGVA